MVVGPSRSAFVIVRTTAPDRRFGRSGHEDPVGGTADDGIEPLPMRRPSLEHGRAAQVDQACHTARLTLNSLPVFDWTMISFLPFGVASMPFTLKPDW